jgi:glucose/mannose transport system substrate-binding protein
MRIGRGACALVASAALGCGAAVAPGDAADAGAPKPLQVVTWYTSGAEKSAFDDLIGVLRTQDPAIAYTNPVDSPLEYNLKAEILGGNPPDSFQVVSGSDLGSWIDMGVVSPLDALSADQGWASAIPAQVLAPVSRNGSLYGVPLDVERENTLFYNKAVLAAQGVAPPQSLADVMAAAATLKAHGVTAFAVAVSSGWTIATELFEDVLVAQAGGDFVQSYLSGQKSADTPEIRTALATLASMMDYAPPDRTTTTWQNAIKHVCAGDAAMIMLPDFVAREAPNQGCAPDALGYVPMQPAGSPTFAFLSVTFPLARLAPDPGAGSEFLATVGSRAGQETFNAALGQMPARTDVDPNLFGPIVRQTIVDYRASGEIFVPGYEALASYGFYSSVDTVLARYVDPTDPANKDVNTVISVLSQSYGLLGKP